MIGDIRRLIGDARRSPHVKGKKWKGEKVVLRIVGIATAGMFEMG